ncbi:MAG: DUF4465 domain-containing protein [Cytophagaceae bacterium]
MKTQLLSFKIILCICSILMPKEIVNAQTVSDFESFHLSDNSFWDGSDNSGGFTCGSAYFFNTYHSWGGWSGFIYSNKKDNSTAGFTNQASVFAGVGFNGSANYAVSYGNSGIKLVDGLSGQTLTGFYVCNTTYAALSMKNGDNFSKKFGGNDGNDPDWFKLTITGYLNGEAKSNKVDFYLADFRNSDNRFDYIVETWKWVDLEKLGNIDSLSFLLTSSDVGDWGMNTPEYFAMDNFNNPLFAPNAGEVGTTAMHKDSTAFVAWATGAVVQRGPQNIANTSLGDASVGNESMALGKPGSNGVVSLGDGGEITVTFDVPITNGPGNDFAVFENGFSSGELSYLELAFVEVSSDGVNFFRFPSVSLVNDVTQVGSFDLTDSRKIHNLAGKYIAGYGTPFDLEDLDGISALDLNRITHVKIIDVVGTIDPDFATFDSFRNKVNDPWPTAFSSSGFDLDAIGVINSTPLAAIGQSSEEKAFRVYPNPSVKGQDVFIEVKEHTSEGEIQLVDLSGNVMAEYVVNGSVNKLNLKEFSSGMYLVKYIMTDKVLTKLFVVQ